MARPLLWLLAGLGIFVLVAAMLAPPSLVLRGLGLSLVAAVPAAAVLVLARDSRRRRDVDGGRTAPDTDPDHEAEH